MTDYKSIQLLTTSINIPSNKIKGDINKLIVYNLKKRYEGVCNKDGYIVKDSIELINRSIGELILVDNTSYIMYNITYKAIVISPSIGHKIKCVINSNNRMGLIGFIKDKDEDTINDSPFIIIIPSEFYDDSDKLASIKEGDIIDVSIEKTRTKYLSTQIQVVAKPV
jgi:DNA-directed RNA polymerase subunit E'/Rpb7